jgi:hypothetical protein
MSIDQVRSRSDTGLACLLIAGAALIVLYWIFFFTTDLTLPDFVRQAPSSVRSQAYLAFERSFPAADGFVATCLALSGALLFRESPLAVLFGLLGAGGLMFLAAIDTLFNVENGLYGLGLATGDAGLALEAVINLACFASAVFTGWRLWTHPLRRI